MEETVQKRSVLKEEAAEIFINSKNAMAVLDANEFERHTGVRSIEYLLPHEGQKRL